jgi:DNA-binding GntR family transcriptional regulator
MEANQLKVIDHNRPMPAYVQLSNHFSEAISQGKYKSGEKLPSESAICREFGVSRTTVRQALQLMVQKGLIFSVHGKGTFVKAPTINNTLTQITSFSQALQQKGLKGKTRIYAYSPRVNEPHAVLGKDVASLELVGYISDAPVVYYRSFFPSDLGAKMWEASKTEEYMGTAFSTYDLYAKIGTSRSRIDQTIRAINASEELAKILSIPVGAALITLESVYYNEDGVALECKTGYYRSDIYSFNVQRNV